MAIPSFVNIIKEGLNSNSIFFPLEMDKKSVPNQTPQKRGRPSKSAVAGEPSRAGNKGSRQVQSGSPTPLSATTGLFLGGAIQPCTIILKSGADLTDLITSFTKEESGVVTIKAAQGMLSEITLEHEGSSKCYMGQWTIYSMTGVFVPHNDGHFSGLTIRCGGPTSEIVQGRVGAPLIVDKAVVVSLGTYNLGLMQKEEWRHGAEPRAARAAQSMDGASPVVQEVGSGIGEQSAPHQTSSSSELRSESPLPVASANAICAVPGRSRS